MYIYPYARGRVRRGILASLTASSQPPTGILSSRVNVLLSGKMVIVVLGQVHVIHDRVTGAQRLRGSEPAPRVVSQVDHLDAIVIGLGIAPPRRPGRLLSRRAHEPRDRTCAELATRGHAVRAYV